MAFWKFWKKKDKKKNTHKEAIKGLEDVDPEGLPKFIQDAVAKDEAAANKDRRLKNSLSISRSGRYKAKKRERQGLLDKPDFYHSQTAATVAVAAGTPGHYLKTGNGGSEGKSSNQGSCGRSSLRELENSMNVPQSAVV